MPGLHPSLNMWNHGGIKFKWQSTNLSGRPRQPLLPCPRGDREGEGERKFGEESGRRSGSWVYICLSGFGWEAGEAVEKTNKPERTRRSCSGWESTSNNLGRRIQDRTEERIWGDVARVSDRESHGKSRVKIGLNSDFCSNWQSITMQSSPSILDNPIFWEGFG